MAREPSKPQQRGAPGERHRVVIVGGGFGGLQAARALRRAPLRVTLVDRRNFHLFQPLLYQVATGALSPANISAPLRSIVRRQRNTDVVLGEVVDFDLAERQCVLANGRLGYDTLIVAAGARPSYFGHQAWRAHAPGLKTIEDATEIRARILSAFERAEHETDPAARRALLTFVVVGGGPTGVELAGALSELSRHTLRHDFRRINPADARIILADASPLPLSSYPENLSKKAAHYLDRLGVTVRTGRMVTDIEDGRVLLAADGEQELIEARTVLWAAGVRAESLGEKLARAAGVEPDRAGRVPVGPDLAVPGRPEVFVIGDMALCPAPDGQPLPGVAPVAIQQGKHAARAIRNRLRGRATPPFRYHDRGSMATVGRSAAVVHIGRVQFGGGLAWLTWLFVHLMLIVKFENRVLVFLQWVWSYVTRGRSARLITDAAPGVQGRSPSTAPLNDDDGDAAPGG